jgi:pimeloyl-ACP methyl ester carboxylesterase
LPSPPVVRGPINFVDCTDQLTAGLPRNRADRINRLEFSCGRMYAPVDYAAPYGADIRLYVVKIHDSSQTNRVGSLVVNPGGPGVSGVQGAINLSLNVSLDVLDHYDIVGFDPRGVFLSGGAQCLTNVQKERLFNADPDVRTPAGLASAKSLFAGLGPACQRAYGQSLPYINSVNTAKDLDLIRQGVDDEQLTYYGQSYGALLGGLYAHEFPAFVHHAVLDGAVDPSAGPTATALQTAAGREQELTQFALDCAKQTDCKALGNARTATAGLIAGADRTPIPTTRAGDDRRASGATVRAALLAGLGDRSRWTELGAALFAAQHGDARRLFALADLQTQRADDGTYTTQFDAYLTVHCNDNSTTPTDAQVQALARSWAVRYPVFGRSAATSLLLCRSWPKMTPARFEVSAPAASPALVIGATHDPFTPLSTATGLVSKLESATLLQWAGAGPPAYPTTSCVVDAVDKYLIDGTRPANGTTCPAQ